MMNHFRWRPQWHTRRYIRHCQKLNRYYAKCQKVAGGHHAELPHVKRYYWLINQDNRRTRRDMQPQWEDLQQLQQAWTKDVGS
jgi:hypothetical protein